jgi:GT2 family glycosyltransferase
MRQSKVVAIIPTVGARPEHLPTLIRQVRNQSADAELQIVLVNNDPRVELSNLAVDLLLEPGMNLGYAGALKFAREQIEADLIWVIQDDMEISKNVLRVLLAALESDQQLAVASPVAVSDSGRVHQYSRGGFVLPDGTRQTRFPSLGGRPSELDDTEPLNWVALSGALVRVRAWDEVKGPDPRFFPVESVDVDFGYRLSETGWRVSVVLQAAVKHEVQGSTTTVMKNFLRESGKQRFAAKHSHGLLAKEPNPFVSRELLGQVAQSASLSFVDFGRHAAREISVLTKQIANEQGSDQFQEWEFNLVKANLEIIRLQGNLRSLQDSLSWRVTKPLRSFGSLIKKLFIR